MIVFTLILVWVVGSIVLAGLWALAAGGTRHSESSWLYVTRSSPNQRARRRAEVTSLVTR